MALEASKNCTVELWKSDNVHFYTEIRFYLDKNEAGQILDTL